MYFLYPSVHHYFKMYKLEKKLKIIVLNSRFPAITRQNETIIYKFQLILLYFYF